MADDFGYHIDHHGSPGHTTAMDRPSGETLLNPRINGFANETMLTHAA